jgi:hypothetical protein
MVSFLSRVFDGGADFAPPNIRRPTFLDYLKIYLALPYSLFRVSWNFNYYSRDKNVINNGKPCSGVKIGAFAKDYSV